MRTRLLVLLVLACCGCQKKDGFAAVLSSLDLTRGSLSGWHVGAPVPPENDERIYLPLELAEPLPAEQSAWYALGPRKAFLFLDGSTPRRIVRVSVISHEDAVTDAASRFREHTSAVGRVLAVSATDFAVGPTNLHHYYPTDRDPIVKLEALAGAQWRAKSHVVTLIQVRVVDPELPGTSFALALERQ